MIQDPDSKKLVKLYLYEIEKEKIMIDTIEAEEWEDIVFIKLSEQEESRDVEALRDFCSLNHPEKKFAILPSDKEVFIYGIAEDTDD